VCVTGLQLSGINAVFYYSTSIFEEHFPSSADRLTVSIGVLNVLLTIVTVFLMDRAGRRVLLIRWTAGSRSCTAVTSGCAALTVLLSGARGGRRRWHSCQFGMMVFAVLFVVAFVKTVKCVPRSARQRRQMPPANHEHARIIRLDLAGG